MPRPESEVRLASSNPVHALRTAHRQGELIRIRRGAYVPSSRIDDPIGLIYDRCIAVAGTLSVRFAFSHDTAALLHGLPAPIAGNRSVSVIQEGRPSAGTSSDVIRHSVHILPASDVTAIDDLPVTALLRTCMDCVRTQRPAHALMTADAALRRLSGVSRFSWEEDRDHVETIRADLQQRIAGLGRGRGVVQARAVIAHADARSESPPESQLRWLVLTHGFVQPEPQGRIDTASGSYYPDLVWTGDVVRGSWSAVALEYDGVVKYETSEDIYSEKLREDALRAAGCLVIRATKADLRRPDRLLSALTAHIAIDPGAAADRRGLLARRG